MKEDKILYVIVDFSKGEDKIVEVLKAGVDVVQLREKNCSSRDYLEKALRLREITRKYVTPFIINDRLDIALLAEADGVHLGQDDIPVGKARKVLGEHKMIGATAKTKEQAILAQEQGANYIGTGAWFPTNTKKDATPLSIETYEQIICSTTIPNVAIGGITLDNCHIPLENQADGLAISSAIMGAENIWETVQEFRRYLNK